MKNKYQRMSKNDKIELKKKFNNTPSGHEKLIRLKRLLIIGIISISVSILMILSAIFNKSSIYDYISGGMLFISGIIFIVGSIKLKIKTLNNFALKQK